MRFRSLVLAPFLAASALAMHCGGTTVGQNASPEGGAPTEGGLPVDDDAGATNGDAIGATTASKVDLLLVVDNSASMADKAKLLASSLSPLLKKVAEAGDVHVGVISTSLGTMGGDVCGGGAQNALAHLSTVGPGNAPLASAAQGFLSYGGGGAANVDTFDHRRGDARERRRRERLRARGPARERVSLPRPARPVAERHPRLTQPRAAPGRR